MKIENKIYVAGHRGLLGSAIVRKLGEGGYRNLILKTSDELDLRDQVQVKDFFGNFSGFKNASVLGGCRWSL